MTPKIDPCSFPSVEAATEAVFSPSGLLVQAGYEVRTSQRSLALAVARAIDSESTPAWVIGEAPCGTGKGLAYLIPGVIAAAREEKAWAQGKRREGETAFRKLVVSTANIALQGQLVNKDIPGVAAILGIEIRAALYKGRQNFLCLERLQEEGSGLITDPQVKRLLDWSRNPSCSGDREDLPWDPGWAWSKLAVTSDQCHGKKCPYYRSEDPSTLCYAERARVGMERAHIVIVNHYMLALSPRPIPSVFLAVDEGHDLEDCVRKATSSSLGDRSFGWMAGRVQTILGPDRARAFQAPLEDLFSHIGAYLEAKGITYSERLPKGWHGGNFDSESLQIIRKVAKEVADLARQEENENESGKLEKLADSIDDFYFKAWTLADGEPHPQMTGGSPSPWAVWADTRQERGKWGMERRITGNMAPADVTARFQAIQRIYPRGLLTSATLTVDGSFSYIRSTLGMEGPGQPARYEEVEIPVQGAPGEVTQVRRQISAAGPVEEMALPSPFDLQTMGALIVPADVLNPKDYRWADWAVQKVIEAVNLAEGRTLVLASSIRQMERYGFALEQKTTYPVKVQGQEGRNELIRWFTQETNGVLVATRSFFQGLDVKGESLSCVVIDRVPFDPPGDPLEDSVAALLAERVKGNPFSVRSLPKACMALAQASGRLIRSQSDRGVVICLDAKVVTGSMATPLRRSFSTFPISRQMADVRRVISGSPVQPQAPVRAGTVRRLHA